jgi:hypothetical protein
MRLQTQMGEPMAAVLGFPQPELRMAPTLCYRLLETMHTAFGTPRLLSNPSHTLRAVVTKTVENLQAFGPQSHVGQFSEWRLNSWSNSILQHT